MKAMVKMLSRIMDEVMVEQARQLLKIDLKPIDGELNHDKDYAFLITQVRGGYDLTLVMVAEQILFQKIAENMSHGELDLDDIPDYAIEYFNMLCGKIVSVYNQEANVTSRFKVPQFFEGRYIRSKENEEMHEELFETTYGERAQIVGIYQ